MKYVVVTGFLGYIGFNLTTTLLRFGYNVLGIDKRRESGELKRFNDRVGGCENGNFIEFTCDLTRLDEVEDLLKFCRKQRIKSDCFINLASMTSVAESINNPALTVGNNVLLQYHALRIATHLGCNRFIQAGSIMEYGSFTNFTDIDTRAWSPYAWSKSIQEDIIRSFNMLDSFDTRTIIISNPIGSLPAVDPSGNMLERNISKVLKYGGELELAVQKNGKRDLIYTRNFISMYELMGVFINAITSCDCKQRNETMFAVVPNPYDDCIALHSVVLFGEFCNRYNRNKHSFKYVKPQQGTYSTAEQPCLLTLDRQAYQMYLNDIPDFLFDVPKYYKTSERKYAIVRERLNTIKETLTKYGDTCGQDKARFDLLVNAIRINLGNK